MAKSKNKSKEHASRIFIDSGDDGYVLITADMLLDASAEGLLIGTVEDTDGSLRTFFARSGKHPLTESEVKKLKEDIAANDKTKKPSNKSIKHVNSLNADEIHRTARTAEKRLPTDDKKSLSPIYEGALDREAMAGAMQSAIDESGLSKRKFAERLGIQPNELRRILDGKTSIETSADALHRAGYLIRTSVVKAKSPKQH